MIRLSQVSSWGPPSTLSAESLEEHRLCLLGLILWPSLLLNHKPQGRKRGWRRPLLDGLSYLPLERGHIGPGVGGGVVAFHSIQVIVIVTACHCINVLAHNTHTQVSMLLLQGLDLEPSVVPWVIPFEGTQDSTSLIGERAPPAPPLSPEASNSCLHIPTCTYSQPWQQAAHLSTGISPIHSLGGVARSLLHYCPQCQSFPGVTQHTVQCTVHPRLPKGYSYTRLLLTHLTSWYPLP